MATTLNVDVQLMKVGDDWKGAWIVNAEPVVRSVTGSLATVMGDLETKVRAETGLGLLDALQLHVMERFGGPM